MAMTSDELKANVDTIVVVIMENRSFDHVLSHLRHPDYGNRKEVDGVEDLKKIAYLNPNTEVIAPRRWWRALEPPNDRQDDIVPPGWRTIPTFGATDGAPTNQPVRNPKIEINQVEDGYVVYDENRDRVHYLNHTAVLVLELCNGEHSPEDIVAILQRTYELPEPPDEEVTACLRQLRREGMVQ